MECREVSEQLAASSGDPGGRPTGPAARAVEAHLRACPSCRADLESYQQLGTALSGLVAHTVEPPAWLHDTLVDSVHARLGRPSVADRLRLPGALRSPLRPERSRGSRGSGPISPLAPRPLAPRPLANPRYAAAGGAVLLAGLAAGAVLIRGRRRRSAAADLGAAAVASV